MRILITNDDGIHAEGLNVCEKIARALSATCGSSRRNSINPASPIR